MNYGFFVHAVIKTEASGHVFLIIFDYLILKIISGVVKI